MSRKLLFTLTTQICLRSETLRCLTWKTARSPHCRGSTRRAEEEFIRGKIREEEEPFKGKIMEERELFKGKFMAEEELFKEEIDTDTPP